MQNRGRHTSLVPGTEREVKWLESLDEVSRVILGETRSTGHSHGAGNLEMVDAAPGGLRVYAYGGGTITELFVKYANPDSEEQLQELIRKRHPKMHRRRDQDLKNQDTELEIERSEAKAQSPELESLATARMPQIPNWRELADQNISRLLNGTAVKKVDFVNAWREEDRPKLRVMMRGFTEPHQFGSMLLQLLRKFKDPSSVLDQLQEVVESKLPKLRIKNKQIPEVDVQHIIVSLDRLPTRGQQSSDEHSWKTLLGYLNPESTTLVESGAKRKRRGGLEPA